VNIQRAIHSGVLDGDSMNKYLKIVLFGFILWLVPFIAGFFFIDAKGNFLIPETFFKSIMIVVGSDLADNKPGARYRFSFSGILPHDAHTVLDRYWSSLSFHTHIHFRSGICAEAEDLNLFFLFKKFKYNFFKLFFI
jgi:hypothetical protein